MTSGHSDLILLVDAMARLHGRLRSALAPAREGSSLSEIEHTVLAAVVEADAPPTVPQIGRSLGHPRQVIQRAANTLAAAGLILFVPNPDHKRASLLKPSPAGAEQQARATARAEAVAASLMQDLDPVQVRQAVTLLGNIRGGVEAHLRKIAA